jgi:hypothetical protein
MCSWSRYRSTELSVSYISLNLYLQFIQRRGPQLELYYNAELERIWKEAGVT